MQISISLMESFSRQWFQLFFILFNNLWLKINHHNHHHHSFSHSSSWKNRSTRKKCLKMFKKMFKIRIFGHNCVLSQRKIKVNTVCENNTNVFFSQTVYKNMVLNMYFYSGLVIVIERLTLELRIYRLLEDVKFFLPFFFRF